MRIESVLLKCILICLLPDVVLEISTFIWKCATAEYIKLFIFFTFPISVY